MRKIYLFLTLMLVSIGVNAEVIFNPDGYNTSYGADVLSDKQDRYLKNIYLTGSKTTSTQYVWDTDLGSSQGRNMFYDKTGDVTFEVEAGEQLTVDFNWEGSWMHGYVYIDDNGNDGFDALWTNSTTFGGDLKSFSFYGGNETKEDTGYNSAGISLSEGDRSTLDCPPFTAPTTPGTYRMRFKIDWNSIDPKGRTGTNDIKANGGVIVDVMLNVVAPKPLVENGKLYRIKNRCMNLGVGKTENANVGDGNGAYLGSTHVVLTNIPTGLGDNFEKNIRDIHCATTSLADAGCVWMFEGSDTDGWAIKNMNNGMYIDDKRGEGTDGNANLYVKFVEVVDSAARFTIAKNSAGYFTFLDNSYNSTDNAGGNYLHASGAGLQIWNATEAASQWQIIPATELEVTLNRGQTEEDDSSYPYWASLHLPFAVAMPNGVTVTANKASISEEEGTVTLESMSGVIPANTGMILRLEDTTINESTTSATLTILSESEISNRADVYDNELSGTNVDIALDGTSNAEYYVLGKDNTNGRVGLRNPSSSVTKIPMNKAYYHTTTPQMNMLMFVMGEATGIDHVKEVTTNNAGDIYDLSGRKVVKMLKGGIYIQNGKKFFAK